MTDWADGLIPEKNQKKWFIGIIIFAIIIFGSLFFWRQGAEDEILMENFNSHYSGKVIKKYIDTNEHNYPSVILQNDSVVMMDQGSYNNIDIGDSIAKHKESFDFIIYKPTDTIIIDVKKIFEENWK